MIPIDLHEKMAESLCVIKKVIERAYARGGVPKSHKQLEKDSLNHLNKLREYLDQMVFRDYGFDGLYYNCSEDLDEKVEKVHLDLVDAFIKLMVVKDTHEQLDQRDLYNAYSEFMHELKMRPVSRRVFYTKARATVFQFFDVVCVKGVYDGIRLKR